MIRATLDHTTANMVENALQISTTKELISTLERRAEIAALQAKAIQVNIEQATTDCTNRTAQLRFVQREYIKVLEAVQKKRGEIENKKLNIANLEIQKLESAKRVARTDFSLNHQLKLGRKKIDQYNRDSQAMMQYLRQKKCDPGVPVLMCYDPLEKVLGESQPQARNYPDGKSSFLECFTSLLQAGLEHAEAIANEAEEVLGIDREGGGTVPSLILRLRTCVDYICSYMAADDLVSGQDIAAKKEKIAALTSECETLLDKWNTMMQRADQAYEENLQQESQL